MAERVKKNILITGSAGFVGRNLVEYLSAQFNIFAPVHADLELMDEGSVRDYIVKNKIQIVIHCANIGGGRNTVHVPDVAYKNLRMFFSIYRNLNRLEKIIHLGSAAAYDMRHYQPKMSEEYFDNHIPVDGYGFAKYACSQLIEKSQKVIELRLFALFGKYENVYIKFVSNAIVRNIFKLPIVIYQNVYFDFLYIDDLVKIIEYFLTSKSKYKIYNTARGKTIDLLTIAHEVNKVGAHKSKIIVNNSGLNTEYSANISRLRGEMPGFKFTPFREAVRDLYAWYERNLDNINREKVARDDYARYARLKIQK